MGERAELEFEGDVQLIDVADLEDEVRSARVAGGARLHYPPWTGDNWRRLDQLPEFAEALATPAARFAANLRADRTAWFAAFLVFALVAGGFLQFHFRSALAADHGALLQRLSVGWESTLAAGGWWTPFTAQLLHQDFLHLIGNAVIVAYCGWRCERAVGAVGLLGVVGGALLGGTVAITALSPLPCIGASVLAFGLWGGQFAIGWRHGAWIPSGLRGYYGAGTVLVTVPLMAWTFTNPEVSFVGHAGAWVGGAAAAMLMPLHADGWNRPETPCRPKRILAALALLVSAPAFALAARHCISG